MITPITVAAGAVDACVHCGFCLAACPTYHELGEEADTPRGRIVLMKEVLEGRMTFEEARPHVDRCLGCLACEPACPSGVRYRDLV
ncbi:MAG: 4Fe-4S dicluster domain-containing protein, partial [Acidimicrobiia bacterium]|nr:4Fe-4S dicluster domain-containing protein [Acidimicrobiia bacterium]